MLRRDREINIFSISALDLFASALGAFILLTLFLLPYYLKSDESRGQKLKQCQAARQQAEQTLAQCRQERQAQGEASEAAQRQAEQSLAQCRQQHAQCLKQLAQTFLAVVIQWPTQKHDVDLHIVDPTGAEFYYEKKRISGRPGELSADTINGPGVEIWELVEAPVGIYKVYYQFYDPHGNPEPTIVKGAIYFRGGRQRLPPVTLRAKGDKPLVATVEVKPSGEVEVRPQ